MTTMGHLSVWRWKDVLLGGCLFCNFDIFLFFCFVYLSLRVSLYLIKGYWWSKMWSGVSFPSLTECLPPPVRRRQCASLPLLWLINRLISAGLSLLLSYSDRKKTRASCKVSFIFLTFFTLNLLGSFCWFIPVTFWNIIWTAQKECIQ